MLALLLYLFSHDSQRWLEIACGSEGLFVQIAFCSAPGKGFDASFYAHSLLRATVVRQMFASCAQSSRFSFRSQ